MSPPPPPHYRRCSETAARAASPPCTVITRLGPQDEVDPEWEMNSNEFSSPERSDDSGTPMGAVTGADSNFYVRRCLRGARAET